MLLARGAGLAAMSVGTSVVGLIGQGVTVAQAAGSTSAQTNATRAVAAYNAMQKYFQAPGGALYRETYPWPGGNAYSYLWEFSRALVGTLALAGVPSSLVGGTSYASAVQSRFAALEKYWDGNAIQPAYDSYVISAGGGDKYHDDNAWIALALIQQYRMGFTTSLDRAKQLFAFAKYGWDSNSRDPHPGGVFWVNQGAGYGLSNHDRGAGASAGNAELGFHLNALAKSSTYYGDGAVVASPGSLGASNMVNWVEQYLDSHGPGANGLYYNVVRSDGTVDTNLWSYNQGVMIGANVLRYQLTRNATYLNTASAIATKALSTYGNFQGQPPSFNVMLFQNMLQLYPYASSSLQSSMSETMQTYADWAWNNAAARNRSTNLFYFDDAGRPVGGTNPPAAQLRDQGAMTQLYALLAWPASNYGKLT